MKKGKKPEKKEGALNTLSQKREKLRTLRFDSDVNKIKNTKEISSLKKEIARLLTFFNEKN